MKSKFVIGCQTQPHSRCCKKHSLLYLRNLEWYCIIKVRIVLRYTIARYVLRYLDKQWYESYSAYLIAYNILSVLSIIAGHFKRDYHLFCIDWKYFSYLLLPSVTCSITMIEKWQRSVDGDGQAGTLLTDISNAFDFIDHELL